VDSCTEYPSKKKRKERKKKKKERKRNKEERKKKEKMKKKERRKKKEKRKKYRKKQKTNKEADIQTLCGNLTLGKLQTCPSEKVIAASTPPAEPHLLLLPCH